MASEPAAKRARVARDGDGSERDGETRGDDANDDTVILKSMSTPVSPPRKRRRGGEGGRREAEVVLEEVIADAAAETAVTTVVASDDRHETVDTAPAPIRSPFQLTAIRDLPVSANVDTLTVRDVFGDPRVVECWEFNFLHDVDFLMGAFDESARQRGLAVHVVHGFWMRDDPRRERLETAARRYQGGANGTNSADGASGASSSPGSPGASVTLHTAFMPEPFGTHHTKMAVLLRNDDTAQVVIHTANLIPHDWCNMTQAVWRSPLLPLLRDGEGEEDDKPNKEAVAGVGSRFKSDFLNYLRSYNQRRSVCRPLVEALARYDFSAVRAVLIGSVPGRHHVPLPGEEAEEEEKEKESGGSGDNNAATRWGWMAIKRALRDVPLLRPPQSALAAGLTTKAKPSTAEVVMQVSSIATLGANDTWLRQTLYAAFSGGKHHRHGGDNANTSKTTTVQRLASFGPLRLPQHPQPPKPQFRVMFPTADEIRRSLDGYSSGTSIHAKIQSPQQQRQLAYMRPMLCHWANDAPDGEVLPLAAADATAGTGASHYNPRGGDAGRRRAAPHVKTYVRYSGHRDGSIDWALMTSANLSKQAWGEARSMAGDMRIASYELGVLVWPELLTDGAEGATMRPVFGRDDFEVEDEIAFTASTASEPNADADFDADTGSDKPPVVPLRIPYSLPIQRYGANEVPWVASMAHDEPDWRGVTAVRWEDK